MFSQDHANPPGPRSWTVEARNARIASLRRVEEPSPDVLYSVRVRGIDYDVVWDGSLRAPSLLPDGPHGA